jgi:hypothetical protein
MKNLIILLVVVGGGLDCLAATFEAGDAAVPEPSLAGWW